MQTREVARDRLFNMRLSEDELRAARSHRRSLRAERSGRDPDAPQARGRRDWGEGTRGTEEGSEDEAMSTKVVAVTKNEGGGATYDVDAAGAKLSIEFYRGDLDVGELTWRADISFVAEEVIIGGEGANMHAAFMPAASREDVVVRGVPLPAITWADVDHALGEAGAF